MQKSCGFDKVSVVSRVYPGDGKGIVEGSRGERRGCPARQLLAGAAFVEVTRVHL